MNFNLKQLEAFVWVSDLGSFRKAADRLNTTQPNISSRISALESVLKVKLMERDAGSVRLTAKGQELLIHARKVLGTTDAFLEAANQESLLNGVLRLGVTEMVVHTWLRDFLKTLKERYPNITVELTVDLSANLEKELFDRSIDLAFQSGPFNRQTSGNEELGVFPLIWIAAPSTGLQRCKKIKLEDLVKFPVLTHARGTAPYQEVAKHFASRRDLSARLVPSSNLSACIHMAIDGFGVATVPASMVVDELRDGELCQICYNWTPESLRFSARYDAEKSAQYVVKSAEIAAEISNDFAEAFAARSRQ
ncbi:MAG: LysR family transcriptional regulator [Granulosicoccus sp.]|nr:LysR family transcriptional regulator [Granulosicoccus sp.]